MNNNELLIKNVNILTKNWEIRKTDLFVQDGKFATIKKDIEIQCEEIIDGSSFLILPGMINLHDDSFEYFLAPRRSFKLENTSVENAFQNYLQLCFQCGITTCCITLTASQEPGIRNWKYCEKIISDLNKIIKAQNLQDNVLINCRYEIVTDKLDFLTNVINKNSINMLTFSDHADKGLSRWDNEKYFRNINYRTKIDKELYNQVFLDAENKRKIFWEKIKDINYNCKNIKIGIHDLFDCTVLKKFHVDYIEFPTNVDVINYAAAHNIKTIMGAPNYLFGTSQNNGIEVKDVLNTYNNICLCSDYMLSSMHRILNKWYSNKEIINIIKMVTFNPNIFLQAKKGLIATGYDADFIMIPLDKSDFHIKYSYIKGKKVFENLQI